MGLDCGIQEANKLRSGKVVLSFLLKLLWCYCRVCVCVRVSAQLCPTLWDLMDCRPSVSSGKLCMQFTRQEYWKVKVKVTLACPTLCNPMDYTVYGILQARILEWVAFPFSRGSSQPRDWTQVSRIAGRFFTSWATIAISFSRGFSRPNWTHISSVSCIGRRVHYQLSHKGSPRILEWVAYPFSSVSSQPRNWTRVSCIAGGFFTNWWTYQVSPSIRKTSNKHKNYVEYIVYQLVWYILYSFTRASIIMCHKLGILKQ